MLKTRIIPIILLKKNSVVKTTSFKDERIVGDATACVKIFSSRMADEMIILDIDASIRGAININLIKRLSKQCFMPLTIGGGIKNMADVDSLFRAGADKISLNSVFYKNKNLIKQISEKYGSQAVVFSLDAYCKDSQYFSSSNSGCIIHDILAVDAAKMAVNYGAGEILLNSVERDGTMIGYDLQLIEKISKEVSVPVIASGGCGCVDYFSQAVRAGASAVAAGSIFHWVGESIISIKRHMDDQGISVRLL